MPPPTASIAATPRLGPQARGTLLLVVAAVAFSTAGFFTREAAVDVWAMVFWRNLFGGLALVPLALAAGRGRLGHGAVPSGPAALGLWGWATIVVSAFATICFLAAFAFTSVADIAIIYATAPLLTALIAWAWRGETISRRTLAGAVLAAAGVAVTLVGALGSGTLRGDGLALAMTVAMSLTTILARRHGRLPILPTACLAALLAAAAVLPLGLLAGAGLRVSWPAAAWLATFGVTTMGVALPCYLAGLRTLPAAEVMLIGALELPLAPLWVWLAFGEAPSRAALAGGAIVTLAIAAQIGHCQRDL